MNTSNAPVVRDVNVAQNKSLHSSLESSKELHVAEEAPAGLLASMSLAFIAFLTLAVLGLPVTATAQEASFEG